MIPSTPRRAVRAGGLLLAVAVAAAAPQLAEAAQPRAGTFAGRTTQSDVIPFTGKVKLTVAKLDGVRQVTKVVARVKLDCQGDPAQTRTIRYTIPPGEAAVSAAGRFRYEITTSPTSGFSIKGKFPARRRATGSFGYSDHHSGCYTGGQVEFVATLT